MAGASLTFRSSVSGGSTIHAAGAELTGFKELTAKLRELEVKLQNKILRKALRAGAKPILAKAKANAPVGTPTDIGGNTFAFGRALGATVKQSAKAAQRAVREEAKVAKKEGNRYPGQLRDSLAIRAIKRNRAGRVGVVVQTRAGEFRGNTFYGAFVEYGTSKMAAKPYMRPAFDTEKLHSIDITSGVIWTELKRAAAGA
jgi:HK97 gp10 family phage protein